MDNKKKLDLVSQINRLTKWLNAELILFGLSLFFFILGIIFDYMAQQNGHGNTGTTIFIGVITTIGYIGAVLAGLLVFTILLTAISRKNKKAILIKYDSSAINRINKPSITAIITASLLPIIPVIATFLL